MIVKSVVDKIDGLPDDAVPLEIAEGQFAGCQIYLDKMIMADEINEDGSCNMTYDYHVINDFAVTDHDALGEVLNNAILEILRAQVKAKAQQNQEVT